MTFLNCISLFVGTFPPCVINVCWGCVTTSEGLQSLCIKKDFKTRHKIRMSSTVQQHNTAWWTNLHSLETENNFLFPKVVVVVGRNLSLRQLHWRFLFQENGATQLYCYNRHYNLKSFVDQPTSKNLPMDNFISNSSKHFVEAKYSCKGGKSPEYWGLSRYDVLIDCLKSF